MEKKNMISKPQLLYIDYYRAFAILMIILGHTARIGNGNIYEILGVLYNFKTALFVFIAGYLFQYLSKSFDYKIYLKKKFLNIVLPYLVIITPLSWLAALDCPINNTFNLLPFYQRFIGMILFGQIILGPTWFIGMIICFFLLSPLFFKLSHSKYFGIVCCCSIIYTLLTPIPDITPGLSPVRQFNFEDIFIHFIFFYIEALGHFMSYWLIGMGVCGFAEKHSFLIKKYARRVFYYTLIIWGFSCFLFFIFHKPARLNCGLPNLISAICFYTGFLYYEQSITAHKWLHNSLTFLAKYSFGLFFIHECFVNLINFHTPYKIYVAPVYTDLTANTFTNFLAGLLFFVAVLGLSCLTLVILKFILKCLKIKHTRWFIGV